MTPAELLSKEKYPLRARTAIEFPKNKLRLVLTAYYQQPPGAALFEGGNDAAHLVFTAPDGLLSFACLIVADTDEDKWYLETDGEWKEATYEEIDGRADQFAKELNLRYGIDLDKEFLTSGPGEEFEKARWEMF